MVQIANVGATAGDAYHDLYLGETFSWIIDNRDKVGGLENRLISDTSLHDYISLDEGRDFLKESKKYGIVILHNLYHPISGEAPRRGGFFGVSKSHSIPAWRHRLVQTGADLIAIFGDDLGGRAIGHLPGYTRYRKDSMRAFYVKDNMKHSSEDPIEKERAKERQDRINAARQEPEYLLPNLHTVIPAQYMREVPWNGQDMVTVWRSIPPDAKDGQIRPGDWVALTRSYAQSLGRGKLVSKRVPAQHIFWAGTDMNEWFYTPTGKMAHRIAARFKEKLDARQAAIIQPPPRIVEQLTKILKKYWAAQQYNETGFAQYRKMKGRAPFLGPADRVKTKIKVNLASWKYGGRQIHRKIREHLERSVKSLFEGGGPATIAITDMLIGDTQKKIVENTLKQDKTVDVVIHGGFGMASWFPMLDRFDFYLQSFDTESELVEAVVHEARHMAQGLISKAVSGLYGGAYALPSRKIVTPDLGGSSDLFQDIETIVQKAQQEGASIKEIFKRVRVLLEAYRQEHHLKDIEFETDLGDAVTQFIRSFNKAQISPDRKKMVVRFYTGQDPQLPTDWSPQHEKLQLKLWEKQGMGPHSFFTTLKTHALPKYKAALKKFYQEIAPVIRLAKQVVP